MITHDWKHIPRSDGVREHWECRCCGQLCSLPVKEKCERWKQRAEKAERERSAAMLANNRAVTERDKALAYLREFRDAGLIIVDADGPLAKLLEEPHTP